MTDRELLEAAARVAEVGPVLCYETARNCLRIGDRSSYRLWRPLTDDGDALRLAVKLYLHEAIKYAHRLVDSEADFYAATRRAIVRAAAALDAGRMDGEKAP